MSNATIGIFLFEYKAVYISSAQNDKISEDNYEIRAYCRGLFRSCSSCHPFA